MIPLCKVERATGIIFKNALRLHRDSILLVKHGSYSSAYQLSILAQEEIGKVHLLEEVAWQARPDRIKIINDSYYEKLINDCFYYHKTKQGWFSKHADDYHSYFARYKKWPKYLKDINDGLFEQKKQNATYVGFPKTNKKPDWSKKINSPNISQKSAKYQITRVNDYIINLTEGCRREVMFVDTDSFDRLLTSNLVKELEKIWPDKSYGKKKELEKIRKNPLIKYD